MAYILVNDRNETRLKIDNQLTTRKDFLSRESDDVKFYEFEPSIVLDVVRDEGHPIFKNGYDISPTAPLSSEYPKTSSDKKHDTKNDPNYSWIGRVLFRQVNSDRAIDYKQLSWALPLETNIKEYPLINEIVIVVKYFNTYYYTRKLNLKNFINQNSDFTKEVVYGDNQKGSMEYESLKGGPISFNDADQSQKGRLGKYFKANDLIRPLRHFEGDMVIESRFGSSIRFGCYVDDKELDKGDEMYADYKDQGGNPMIFIRNRQRKISKSSGNDNYFQANILEDINKDGSSIQMTCGLTVSKWDKTNFKKQHFQEGLEEQPKFSPGGSTTFKWPKLDKDQLVFNSDRIIIASRNSETFHFSKKRYTIVTDDEYCVDAHKQIVLTTNTKTVFNSPFIYLGEYNKTKEPVLLGQTTIEWLYELCEWLKEHTHYYRHSHPHAGEAQPDQTQLPIQIKKLMELQKRLPDLLSRRVFVTGGGYEPGQDGGKIPGGTTPGQISNIPGGFYGNVPKIKS